MKIEKLNDNQIRATLTREDLESRHLTLAEFAYGTDNARNLFNELLRFASYKFGFEVDDTPLMVEAVPISVDTIVLTVTKVPYPEELDTRFARFSDAPFDEEMGGYEEADYTPWDVMLYGVPLKATDILDVTAEDIVSEEEVGSVTPKVIPPQRFDRMFRFESLDDVFEAARVLKGHYHGSNTLYHTRWGYDLIVHIGDHTADDFNRTVNILSEYAAVMPVSFASDGYSIEHARLLVQGDALQALAEL